MRCWPNPLPAANSRRPFYFRRFGDGWATKSMRAFLTILALSSILVGCNSKQTSPTTEQAWPPSASALKKMQSDYDAALADATNSIPYARDFVRLYPRAWFSFSYYTGVVGPSSLNMKVLLYDRYEFGMKVPVTFDTDRRKVTTFGEPEFLLLEISEITNEKNGNLHIQYNTAGGRRFGSSEWKSLVGAQGDFSIIGYKYVTNSPVPRIQELQAYWDKAMSKQP